MTSCDEKLDQAIEPSTKRKKCEKKAGSAEDKETYKICIYFCEKKKRQCKFNALKNCEYCTWHDSKNLKVIESFLSYKKRRNYLSYIFYNSKFQ